MQRIVPFDKQIAYKSKRLLEMRKEIVLGYENYFNQFVKRAKVGSLSLSENFTPLTLYANHHTKQ